MALTTILASHGLFAQEALNSAKMIVGQPRMEVLVLSVTEGRTLDDCYEELANMYKNIPSENEVLILVDMFGGTPSNVATMLLLNQESDARLQVYAGFNLPMLLELFAMNPSELTQAKHLVEVSYSNAFIDLNEKTKGVVEDGDQAL